MEIYIFKVSSPLSLPLLNIPNCQSVLKYLLLYRKLFIFVRQLYLQIRVHELPLCLLASCVVVTYVTCILVESLDSMHLIVLKNVGPDLDPNCLTPWWYLKRVKYGKIIKCEGIIKAIFENPKTDQNTLFSKYVFFNHLDLYF